MLDPSPQLCNFLTEVAGGPGYIICNSVGGLAGLEAAIARPDLVKGVQLINISLRHACNARREDEGCSCSATPCAKISFFWCNFASHNQD